MRSDSYGAEQAGEAGAGHPVPQVLGQHDPRLCTSGLDSISYSLAHTVVRCWCPAPGGRRGAEASGDHGVFINLLQKPSKRCAISLKSCTTLQKRNKPPVLAFSAGGAPRVPLVWVRPFPATWPLLRTRQDAWMSPRLPVQQLHRRSPHALLFFSVMLRSPSLGVYASVLPACVCTTCMAPHGLPAWGFVRKRGEEDSCVAHLSTSSSRRTQLKIST